ncbi:hypothetical protein DR64_779 [Paraburkholderia xenovorans LB400]|uniref:Uncharacterized protein n=1 Tax=Paraburkholderia xenovorans (strain LB400) TaxID=266265 RepID=Q141V4_PARXL|nr:hypothetical protein [Paraburkholderia xenovorans]ABE29885.1 hypothetical protein Bxe_A3094 [Paraburkholderia xenovorans LB400]AIP33039.1 hypothetical protein DR64_779 [Paraburkholderia xenovorans LB400]
MSWISVDVDVSDVLCRLDTDDLLKEIGTRNRKPEGSADISVQQIFEAFYTGNEAIGVQLSKAYVQQVTGRVLP